MVCGSVLPLEHVSSQGSTASIAGETCGVMPVRSRKVEQEERSLPVAVLHGQDAPVPEDSAHGPQVPRPQAAQQAKHGR